MDRLSIAPVPLIAVEHEAKKPACTALTTKELKMPNVPQRRFKSEPQVRGQLPERPDERGRDHRDPGSAYISPWERLSDASERVMAGAGLSKDEAQSLICRAVADGAIEIRGKLGMRFMSHSTASDTILNGEDFQIPTDLKPEHLDWEQSRPVKPWFVRRESRLWGHWYLQWIKVCRTDVTKALCPDGRQGESAQPTFTKTGAKSRSRPALERARRAINELYPQGVPGQATEPNAVLCRRVGEKLKRDGLPAVSDDTILRAAGRRK